MKVRNAASEQMSKKEVDKVRIFFCHWALNHSFNFLKFGTFFFLLSLFTLKNCLLHFHFPNFFVDACTFFFTFQDGQVRRKDWDEGDVFKAQSPPARALPVTATTLVKIKR